MGLEGGDWDGHGPLPPFHLTPSMTASTSTSLALTIILQVVHKNDREFMSHLSVRWSLRASKTKTVSDRNSELQTQLYTNTINFQKYSDMNDQVGLATVPHASGFLATAVQRKRGRQKKNEQQL